MSLCNLIISFSVCSGHTDNWTDVAIISLTAKLSNTRVAVMAVVGKCEMKSISPLDALNLHEDRHQVELRKRRLNFSRPSFVIQTATSWIDRDQLSDPMEELLNSLSGRFTFERLYFCSNVTAMPSVLSRNHHRSHLVSFSAQWTQRESHIN